MLVEPIFLEPTFPAPIFPAPIFPAPTLPGPVFPVPFVLIYPVVHAAEPMRYRVVPAELLAALAAARLWELAARARVAACRAAVTAPSLQATTFPPRPDQHPAFSSSRSTTSTPQTMHAPRMPMQRQ
uniref:Uncharacterized protein n=1 Tax=mine drainage metagenome TaxID=410659 RepID=E6QQW7_9ZZZZ